MPDMNQCNFTGRLGKDPVITGEAANFSIAVDDSYKSKTGEKVSQTEWVNVVAFGKTAEVVEQYLRKGSRVQVTGKFKTQKYKDNEGVEKYSTKIHMERMVMLDSKPAGDNDTQREAAPSKAASQEFDDDIPF